MDYNSYWYIGLGAASLCLLCFVGFRKGWSRTLLLFLSMVGLGYIIEAVIYIFLSSYSYHPKLLGQDPYYDSNLGAIVSNTFSLPMTAAFIAAYGIGWWGILGFAGLFMGIEWLFLRLQLYTHHWWRLEYTGVGLLFYYTTSRFLYKHILHPKKSLLHYVIVFLITGAIAGTLHISPIMFFSNRSYTPGWFENPSHNTTAFSSLFYVSASLCYVAISSLPNVAGWLKGLLSLSAMLLATWLLSSKEILHIHVWWDPFYYAGLSLFGVWFAGFVHRRIWKGSHPQSYPQC
jgi:hypothetical protein